MTNMTSNLSTLAKLRAYLTNGMELDPVPNAIAARAAERAGKPITKRDADALEAQFPGMHFSLKVDKFDCSIEWYCAPVIGDPEGKKAQERWPHSPKSYQSAGTIYLKAATQTWTGEKLTGTRWPTAEALKTKNARYFAAKDARNANRRASLLQGSAESQHLENVANHVDAALAQQAKLVRVRENAGDLLSEADYAIDQILKGDL